MDDAYILPGVWAKGLLYRPQNLTNVFVTDGFTDVRLPRAGRDSSHRRKVGEGTGGRAAAARWPRAGAPPQR